MKKMVMIVFPHAGGFAGYYSFMKNYHYEKIDEILLYEYPGRGSKGQLPLCDDMRGMVQYILDDLKDVMNQNDIIFFGHSMGALVAFETASKYYLQTGKKIKLFIASGETSPFCTKSFHVDYRSEKAVCDYISSMGGTSKELLELAEAREFFLPIIQNDLKVAEEYIPISSNNQKISENVCVMYGSMDQDITDENIRDWKNLADCNLGKIVFTGDHFYLNSENKKNQEVFFKTLNHLTEVLN